MRCSTQSFLEDGYGARIACDTRGCLAVVKTPENYDGETEALEEEA